MSLREEFLSQLQERRDALKPAAEEYAEVEKLLADLGYTVKRETKPKPKVTTKPKVKPRERSHGRASEFLGYVERNPGITVSEIARQMGLSKPNYLYRIKKDLIANGHLRETEHGLEVVSDESVQPTPPKVEVEVEVEADTIEPTDEEIVSMEATDPESTEVVDSWDVPDLE